mgnify:CR=1 FL=1
MIPTRRFVLLHQPPQCRPVEETGIAKHLALDRTPGLGPVRTSQWPEPARRERVVREVARDLVGDDDGGVLGAANGTLTVMAGGDSHGHSHGHSQSETDPHAWQSVANAKVYVANIRDALIKADPAGKTEYEANARAYTEKLDALEKEIRTAVNAIPKARRKIITSHDAFAYFSATYGVEFVAPQGVSTDSEASAQDVARIIRQIRSQKIPAVFLENVSDPRLVKRIADETGARLGGTLYSDALSSQDGPAPDPHPAAARPARPRPYPPPQPCPAPAAPRPGNAAPAPRRFGRGTAGAGP